MSLVQHRLALFVGIFLVSLSILAVWVDSQPVSANSDDTTEFFEKRIRPILMTNSSPCHNPQAYVAKLDLPTAEGFARGGESGALINPANPEQKAFWAYQPLAQVAPPKVKNRNWVKCRPLFHVEYSVY